MSSSHESVQNSSEAQRAVECLSVFKERFDPMLEDFFASELKRIETIRPELLDFFRVGAEFAAQGGKRVRPAFLFYGYKASGGKNDEAAIRSSISVELIHAGALVHDDIMDHSDLRRGRPTVHMVLGTQLGNSDTGNSMAILAGNTIFSLAGKALSQFPDSARVVAARAVLDELCLEVNYGQCLDVLGNQPGSPFERDWIMKVMEYKTAGYTVEKPLLIGALLAGAKPEVLHALSEYGKRVGIVFQIQDDILGMFGDEQKVGKPVDSDLKEGKKTLLVFDTIEKLSKESKTGELKQFLSILGNPKLTQEDYVWVQNLMVETGALDSSRDFASTLVREAKVVLENVGIDSEAREYLLGIADFMLQRDR